MNKKLIGVVAVFGILMTSFAIAEVVNYFHQTQVDFEVSEARTSEDLPFSLSCYSGETKTHDLTMHNNADVPLEVQLTFDEISNPNAVTYGSNLPQIVELAPLVDTTFEVSITCDETTEAGTVTGLISYTKYASA